MWFLTYFPATLFSKSKLSLTSILKLMYCLILRRPVRCAAAETENSLVSSVQWYQYCRDLASWKMEHASICLGGAWVVVEIDETVLMKRKYSGGKKRATSMNSCVVDGTASAGIILGETGLHSWNT